MYPMVSCGLTWAVLSVSFRNFSLTTMFLGEDNGSPPALCLTPPPTSLPSCVAEVVGGASDGTLSFTELAAEDEDDVGEKDKELLLVEDRGVSCGAETVPSVGGGSVEALNRCSGGSEVWVEIHASSNTNNTSSEPKSSVTSSPTPSIRAIAHDDTPANRRRSLASAITSFICHRAPPIITLSFPCECNQLRIDRTNHNQPDLLIYFQRVSFLYFYLFIFWLNVSNTVSI